jgi:hypothetical protein
MSCCSALYAELHPQATKLVAAQFLRNLVEAVPYKLHTVLTDNGIQFTNREKDRHAFMRSFDRVCAQHGTDHRLTKPNHLWTNGQVECMNRTLKDTTVRRTVRRYQYETHQHLEEPLHAFLMAYILQMAYIFAKRLKTLRGLTPYDFVCASWQKEPDRFRLDPRHHTLGLNTNPDIANRVR